MFNFYLRTYMKIQRILKVVHVCVYAYVYDTKKKFIK